MVISSQVSRVRTMGIADILRNRSDKHISKKQTIKQTKTTKKYKWLEKMLSNIVYHFENLISRENRSIIFEYNLKK